MKPCILWVGHKRGVASAPPHRSSELRTFMLLLYFIVVLSYVVNRFSIRPLFVQSLVLLIKF